LADARVCKLTLIDLLDETTPGIIIDRIFTITQDLSSYLSNIGPEFQHKTKEKTNLFNGYSRASSNEVNKG
jgi:hypothetical protein